jgi:hypothetical protein
MTGRDVAWWWECYLECLAEECSMMIEVQAAYFILKRWNQNPAATKRQIGIWQHWKEETEDNHRPLSGIEVERMKAFVRRNAPTSYFEMFPEQES